MNDFSRPPTPIQPGQHRAEFGGAFTPPKMVPPSSQNMPAKPKEITPGSFSDLLSQRIKASGKSIAEVAKLAKVTDQTVRNWLNGSEPAVRKQSAIMAALTGQATPADSEPAEAVPVVPSSSPAHTETPAPSRPEQPARAILAKSAAQARARQGLLGARQHVSHQVHGYSTVGMRAGTASPGQARQPMVEVDLAPVAMVKPKPMGGFL